MEHALGADLVTCLGEDLAPRPQGGSMSAMNAASACASRAMEAEGVEAGPTSSRFAFFLQALDWKLVDAVLLAQHELLAIHTFSIFFSMF